MSKIKFFKMDEENSDAVNAFLDTVRVAQDGMFCSEGKLAVVYKDKDEVGMSQDEKVAAFSGHLSKWQGDLIANSNLYRSFVRLVDEVGVQAGQLSIIADEKKAIVEQFQATYDPTLEDKISKLAISKKGRESEEYITLQSEFNTYKATFDARVSELSKEATEAVFDHANHTALQKEYAGEVEKYKKAVEKANIMIEDIENCIKDVLSK